MLEWFNLLLIVVIIGVLVMDTVFLFRARNDIKSLQTNVADDRSLVDLSEFKYLNPSYKKHYKTYVVNGVMPPIVKKMNQELDNAGMNEYLTKNEYDIQKQLKAFADSV